MSAGKSKQQLAAHRERIRIFMAAVTAGASDRSAAAEAGISTSTLHRWHHGERPFDELMRNRLARARATRERRWLEWVEQAAQPGQRVANNGNLVNTPGDWRAAQFLLSVTNAEYAQRVRSEISGPGGGPVQSEVDVTGTLASPDPERLAKVADLLQTAGAMPQLEAAATNGNGNGRDHD